MKPKASHFTIPIKLTNLARLIKMSGEKTHQTLLYVTQRETESQRWVSLAALYTLIEK